MNNFTKLLEAIVRPSKDPKLLKLMSPHEKRRVKFFRTNYSEDKADAYVLHLDPVGKKAMADVTDEVEKVWKIAHKKHSKHMKGKGAEKSPASFFQHMSAEFDKAFPGALSTRNMETVFGMDLRDRFKTAWDYWEYIAPKVQKSRNKKK